MLTATNITYRIGSKPLVSDISLLCAPGKLNLIIGPNGAGKSTLIKILARLLRPQSGQITYGDVNVARMREPELARCRAVLSQAVEVAFPLTVREVVMMGRYPHFGGRPGPADDKIVDDVMAHFDVTEFSQRTYQTLSGGERQRVNFARVLAQLWGEPRNIHDDENGLAAEIKHRYLFLDEPLTFLDIRHQIDFMKKVRAFAGAPDVVTVGVVHDLNLAAQFADHIVLLNEGRIAASGTADEVLTADRIREVFHVEPTFIPETHAGVHLIFN